MAGLHFSCGKWMGGDKSADPLFDIIPNALSKFIADDGRTDWERFLTSFNEQAESEELELTPEMMRAIIEPLGRYHEALARKLGLSESNASLEELGKYPRVESTDERKLGCVRDLLAGNEVCQRTKQPITVIFV